MPREFHGIYKYEYSIDDGATFIEAKNVEVNASSVTFPDQGNDDQDAVGGRYPGVQMREYAVRFFDAAAGRAIDTNWRDLSTAVTHHRFTLDGGETHTFEARPTQVKPDDVQGSASEGRADGWNVTVPVLDRDVTEA